MPEQESSLNTTTSLNKGYNVASALQVRLDSSQIIENVELFLRGTKLVVEQDPTTNKITTKRLPLGKAKANDIGVQSVLNWIQLILNPQIVQGNFPVDSPAHSTMYEDYIYYARIDFTEMLIINCYDWEICDNDINVIVDSIMNAVEPFMTRLIDNKERESYDSTLRHVETSSTKEGKEAFKLFG